MYCLAWLLCQGGLVIKAFCPSPWTPPLNPKVKFLEGGTSPTVINFNPKHFTHQLVSSFGLIGKYNQKKVLTFNKVFTFLGFKIQTIFSHAPPTMRITRGELQCKILWFFLVFLVFKFFESLFYYLFKIFFIVLFFFFLGVCFLENLFIKKNCVESLFSCSFFFLLENLFF